MLVINAAGRMVGIGRAHADVLAVPIIFSVLFGLANIWCFSGIL